MYQEMMFLLEMNAGEEEEDICKKVAEVCMKNYLPIKT
jgi:hypothetical protein